MGCIRLDILDEQYKKTELKVSCNNKKLTSNFCSENVRSYSLFGTTSYRSGRSETEVSLKRYKYNGKERDEETGLYMYGMRYYAAWLCRFVSCDPLQFKYPHYTPFQYAGNKPITFIDLDGGEEKKPPLHHEFLTTAAINIYDVAKEKGATAKGTLLVMAQASLESGYGKSAIKNKDYNLFGTMTLGNDYKETTSHGKLKDFSNSGGYSASIQYYFDKNNRKWSNFANLIKSDSFSADDIDKTFYTGKYIEWKEERNKTGHLSYNFDNVDESTKTNNNAYGTALITQMKSFMTRFINSLDYQIEQNQNKISEINNSLNIVGPMRLEDINRLNTEKENLNQQNKKFEEIKNEIDKVKF